MRRLVHEFPYRHCACMLCATLDLWYLFDGLYGVFLQDPLSIQTLVCSQNNIAKMSPKGGAILMLCARHQSDWHTFCCELYTLCRVAEVAGAWATPERRARQQNDDWMIECDYFFKSCTSSRDVVKGTLYPRPFFTYESGVYWELIRFTSFH